MDKYLEVGYTRTCNSSVFLKVYCPLMVHDLSNETHIKELRWSVCLPYFQTGILLWVLFVIHKYFTHFVLSVNPGLNYKIDFNCKIWLGFSQYWVASYTENLQIASWIRWYNLRWTVVQWLITNNY